jgi:hypothetical protein
VRHLLGDVFCDDGFDAECQDFAGGECAVRLDTGVVDPRKVSLQLLVVVAASGYHRTIALELDVFHQLLEALAFAHFEAKSGLFVQSLE